MTRLSVQPAIMIGGAVGIWRACVICMAEGGARVAGFDQTGAEGDRGQAVNVKGVFFGAKHVIPHLRAGGGGVDQQSVVACRAGGYRWHRALSCLERGGASDD